MAQSVEATNSGLADVRLLGRGSGGVIRRELSEASPWAKGIWAATLVIGLVDAYRWHYGGLFGYDFVPIWQAAHALMHGHTAWSRFVYPPGCLLVALPLAVLPFRMSEVIVYAVQIAGIAYLFWAMTRLIRVPLGSVRVAWFALFLAAAGQLGIAAHYENFTLLLVPLAAAFFLAVDRERPMAAAIVLGISLTIKPLLVPLLIVLVVARRWRETAVAVIIPVVLSAITIVMVIAMNANPSGFFHEVAHTFSADYAKPWNISLSAMAGYLHVPGGIAAVVRALVIVASLFACWRIWKNPGRRAGEQAVWLTAPLFAILILCFSFAWAYYGLLLLPLGFVALRKDGVADWVVRAGVFLALAPPLLVYTLPGYPGSYYPANGNGIFGLGILINGASAIGVLVVLAGTLVHASRVDRVDRVERVERVEASRVTALDVS